MQLKEAPSPTESTMLKIPTREVRLIWASGYFDGPTDGIARFRNQTLWFSMAEEAEDELSLGWYRRFWLIRLSKEQLQEVLECHCDFRRFVGTHYDYDEHGKRDTTGIMNQAEWPKFYDKYSPNRDFPQGLSNSEVVGWFED